MHFFGFNPGCDPTVSHPIRWTIEQSLVYFQQGFTTLAGYDSGKANPDLINDQRCPKPNFNGDYEKGQAPYQKRTRCLLEAIGHGDALVTNLFFRQTRDAQELRDRLNDDFMERCWRVHEHVLEITNPEVIITCRGAIEGVFRRTFELGSEPVQEIGAEHGRWKCRHWRGQWQSKRIDIIEIPHLSRYDITKPSRKTVLDWTREIVSQVCGRQVGGPA